eukprot:TRINITY_DN46712_c0_g1_i1.p1 TRINITY_DN46712_c0_g1~~TRINITY_DN46712_c0_g1_i1.p1  ORF type:complete len:673 (-),score=73.21 TRINITY_DN46712_c0_g1_i1:36-2054(-)
MRLAPVLLVVFVNGSLCMRDPVFISSASQPTAVTAAARESAGNNVQGKSTSSYNGSSRHRPTFQKAASRRPLPPRARGGSAKVALASTGELVVDVGQHNYSHLQRFDNASLAGTAFTEGAAITAARADKVKQSESENEDTTTAAPPAASGPTTVAAPTSGQPTVSATPAGSTSAPPANSASASASPGASDTPGATAAAATTAPKATAASTTTSPKASSAQDGASASATQQPAKREAEAVSTKECRNFAGGFHDGVEVTKAMAKTLGIFCGSLYTCLAIGVIVARYNYRNFGDIVQQILKKAASQFATRPRLPAACCTVLFGIADIVAQFAADRNGEHSYWCGGHKGLDLRSSLAVAVAAGLIHGGAWSLGLARLDKWLQEGGEAVGITGAFGRVVTLVFATAFLYLPIASLAIGAAAGWTYRFTCDMWEYCAAAAFVSLPADLGTAIGVHAERLPAVSVTSAAFFAPLHVGSYLLVTRWAPEARVVVDGALVLLWNIVAVASGSPAGVGPVLSGLAPLQPRSPDEAVLVDCSRWSAWAVLTRIASAIVAAIKAIVQGIAWLCKTIAENTWRFLCTSCRVTAFMIKGSWFCVCSLVKSSISLTRLTLWLFFHIIWQTICFPFWLWDKIKWMGLVTVLIPAPFPYESKPYAKLWPYPDQPEKDSSIWLCCRPSY